MDKTTKTKIIVFASFGIFVLLVLVIVMALSGSDDDENMQDVNTSLRAQQQSDFTIDDMMSSEAKPEYENFSDKVYHERAEGVYTEDPEVLALQQQLRANQRADSMAKAAPKPKTVKKKTEKPKNKPAPEPENKPAASRFFSGDKPQNTGNTIEAIVSGDQKITSGSVIKLVTLQEMQLPNGLLLDKGTALFGTVKLDQDRINIAIESVRVGNSIYELKKTVYDQDGLPGIYVPLNIKAEASKEAADEVVGDLNTGIYGTDVLSTGVNAVSNAAKSVNGQIIRADVRHGDGVDVRDRRDDHKEPYRRRNRSQCGHANEDRQDPFWRGRLFLPPLSARGQIDLQLVHLSVFAGGAVVRIVLGRILRIFIQIKGVLARLAAMDLVDDGVEHGRVR